jgi:UDP-N-acetylmuramyl pentapeptide phosphotransferase/UDP-N-acetylglucosamine-1-phosphate transferase
MNLFDLRPGRCIKVFLVLYLALIIFSGVYYPVFLPIAGAIAAYFPFDLKGRVMMGDAGSNVLGITLGIMALYGLGLWAKAVIVVLLIGLHVLTEKYSLSAIIQNNVWLRRLDDLGRSD